MRLAHWVRAPAPPLALGGGGISWTGPALPAAGADAAGGAAPAGGGTGSGQIGSTADWVDWPVIVALGLGDCLRACRGAADPAADGLGFAAAAAATPGKTGPVGSGFMMLTAGMEAALGKSMLTILRVPCPVEPVGLAGVCVVSASGGTSDPALQTAA